VPEVRDWIGRFQKWAGELGAADLLQHAIEEVGWRLIEA
jgi:hypothetical protein